MALSRISLLFLSLAFAALIVWAALSGDLRAEGAWLISHAWGLVSLTDLYIGFLISALVIAFFEKPIAAALWIIPIPFLGNVWTLLWLALRLPALRARLSAPDRGLHNSPKGQ
jgi:hypothetical protein